MKISIVIPCHQGGEYLGQTIGSVIEQTRQPYEIIVLVERLSDTVAQVARNFGSKIKVYEAAIESAGNARRVGADIASGEAYLFLGPDDVLAPNTLLGLEAALEQAPEGVAYVPWKYLKKQRETWVEHHNVSDLEKTLGNSKYSMWLAGVTTPISCLLWSRAAFSRTTGENKGRNSDDDIDPGCRAYIEGIPFSPAKLGHVYVRNSTQSDTGSGNQNSDTALLDRLEVWQKIATRQEKRGFHKKCKYYFTYSLWEIISTAEQQNYEAVVQRGRKLASYYSLDIADFKPAKSIKQKFFQLAKRIGLFRELYRENKIEIEVTYGLSASRRSLASAQAGSIETDPIEGLEPNPAIGVVASTPK